MVDDPEHWDGNIIGIFANDHREAKKKLQEWLKENLNEEPEDYTLRLIEKNKKYGD